MNQITFRIENAVLETELKFAVFRVKPKPGPLALGIYVSFSAACAAARRAMGTRKGEQET